MRPTCLTALPASNGWINHDGDADGHVRRLFTALDLVLGRWQRDAPDNPLVTGLRPIFLSHT